MLKLEYEWDLEVYCGIKRLPAFQASTAHMVITVKELLWQEVHALAKMDVIDFEIYLNRPLIS